MVQRLIKIEYQYYRKDVDFTDSYLIDEFYMIENIFMNYDDLDVCKKVVEFYLNESHEDRLFKAIVNVKYLGHKFCS